jgi:hypothetical protein
VAEPEDVDYSFTPRAEHGPSAGRRKPVRPDALQQREPEVGPTQQPHLVCDAAVDVFAEPLVLDDGLMVSRVRQMACGRRGCQALPIGRLGVLELVRFLGEGVHDVGLCDIVPHPAIGERFERAPILGSEIRWIFPTHDPGQTL